MNLSDAELVAACMAEGRKVVEGKIAETDQPPLDEEETELLTAGVAAGVAGALLVIERIAAANTR